MIRKANQKDIPKIMEMIKKSKEIMEQEGNPQWQNGYSSEDLFVQDLEKESLYVFESENEIKGCICAEKNAIESYEGIKESTKKDSYVLHRLCIHPDYRHQKLAMKLLEYCEELAKEEQFFLLKADTGIHNQAMVKLFLKLGYQQKAEFEWNDYPGRFLYFEKDLGSERHEV